ncbi:MAG: hypothetical protein A2804_03585 [Candidatus Pacebacteria bacterium RIFCSPHIGHO2_01_FULL_46_10]|nr:MAG: hypothetical protein A2804_03585 [Candidatus Pacebacteria bacterium RIFCSPHIGHO2_01_FULL_46_10]
MKFTTVLLDTNVVSGLLDENKNKSSLWTKTLQILCSSLTNYELIVPTPVCFELKQGSKYWVENIPHIDPAMFRYSGAPIQTSILSLAATYLRNCLGEMKSVNRSEARKISLIDAFIASYALQFHMLIVTKNQKDFPEKYFAVEHMVLAPQTSAIAPREIMFLLRPRQGNI